MDFKTGLGALLQGASGMQGLQGAAQQGGIGQGMGLGGLADILKQRVMAEQLLREKLTEPMSRGQDQSFVPRVPTPNVPMPNGDSMGMGRPPNPGMFGGTVSTTNEYRGTEQEPRGGSEGDMGYGWTSYTGEDYAAGRPPNDRDYVGYSRAKDLMERTAPTDADRQRKEQIRSLQNQIIEIEAMPDGPEKQYRMQEIERQMDQLRGAQ